MKTLSDQIKLNNAAVKKCRQAYAVIVTLCFLLLSCHTYGQSVPLRKITINGVTQDLGTDRTWFITALDTAGADSAYTRYVCGDTAAVLRNWIYAAFQQITDTNTTDATRAYVSSLLSSYSTSVALLDSVTGRVKYTDSTSIYSSLKRLKDTAAALRAYVSAGFVTNVSTNSSLSGGPITGAGTLAINLSNTNAWQSPITWSTSLGSSFGHVQGPRDANLNVKALSAVAVASVTAVGNGITFAAANAVAATSGSSSARGGSISFATGQDAAFGSVTAGSPPGDFTVTIPDATTTATRTAGGAISLTAGKGRGSSTTSGGITLKGGDGYDVSTGGGATLISGAGSTRVSDGAFTSPGGTTTVSTGAGGAITGSTLSGGSVGGTLVLSTGNGGASGSNAGGGSGSGGPLAITSGNGGSAVINNSTGTVVCGDGGTISVQGGTGGSVSAGYGTASAGKGASISIITGTGGNANNTGNPGTKNGGDGGNITLQTSTGGTGLTVGGQTGSITMNIGGTNNALVIDKNKKINAYGDIVLAFANTLDMPTIGTGKVAGSATLASGTVTVSCPAVKIGDLIFLTVASLVNTSGSPVVYQAGSIVAGASFVITAYDPTSGPGVNTFDNSIINWVLIHTH